MSIINLENIRFSFQSQTKEEMIILNKIDLTVDQGEFHIITGPSGS